MNKNNFFINLWTKLSNNDTKILEKIIFIIYIVSVITLSCFHEPWFDEFQAWGISKDSLYNILFVIPHFECHPPLWHIILKCFSIFNVPAELCIKIPNLIFILASVWLILFKSPFPRAVKLTLPFTYFLFYQYAVISRPYSMLVFALLLGAILYKTKNSNPFRFICILGFLSLTSMYGMVLATGITLAWVYEIWDKQNIKIFITNFIKDKRFYAMLILFFFCLFLSVVIFPDKNITAHPQFNYSTVSIKILYPLLGTLADSTISNLLNYTMSNFSEESSLLKILLNYILGIYLYIVLFKYLSRQKLIGFFFVLLVLALFFVKYVWPHHLGIIFIFLIFVFWINYENNTQSKPLDKPLFILVTLTLVMHLFWSAIAAANEIKYDYSPYKNVSSYIKKYSLTDYKIFAAWSLSDVYTDEKGKKVYNKFYLVEGKKYDHSIYENTNYQVFPVLINPYFNHNIFYNFNSDNGKILYIHHAESTDKKNLIAKLKWFRDGNPDIIIADYINPEQPFYQYVKDYNILKLFNTNMIWKDSFSNNMPVIYVRKDKYKEIMDRIHKN